jgi:transcription initiation factor TFIIE subunit alpha
MMNVNEAMIQETLKTSQLKGGTEMLNDPVIQELLVDITNDDENSISIIECLINGKLTDEEIAEETEIRLNIVRRILYKLYDAGIASYKRSKDPETQWYTYSWKFEEKKVFEIIQKIYDKSAKELRKSLQYEESNIFFKCKSTGSRYTFEEASENNFMCPDCKEKLVFDDNSILIAELKEKIN